MSSAFTWSGKTDGIRRALADFRFPLCGREFPARASRRARDFLRAFLILLGSFQANVLHSGAVTRKRSAIFQQFFSSSSVHFQSLRLEVRTFVPFNAEPAKAFENALNKFGTVAFHVRVFYSKKERTAFAMREEPIEKSRSRAADVEIPGRRGSEAHARFRIRSHILCGISLVEKRPS